jgi:hypothetical protein
MGGKIDNTPCPSVHSTFFFLVFLHYSFFVFRRLP